MSVISLTYFPHGPGKWKDDSGHNMGIHGIDVELIGPKQQDTENQEKMGKEEAERGWQTG